MIVLQNGGNVKKAILLLVVVPVLILPLIAEASTPAKNLYEKGVDEYNKENYEEAIQLLGEARRLNPEDTFAAFYLGMAYKETMDYENAGSHLLDAVQKGAKIKEALVELVHVQVLLKKSEEARKWIQIALKEGIFPAKMHYLLGIVEKDEGNYKEAVICFENAAKADPSYRQSADYEIALCLFGDNDLTAARELFQTAILHDPGSDQSSFARQYLDLIDQRMELEKPFRLTIGMLAQYDTNVVLKPDSSVASDITDEESMGLVGMVLADYTPRLGGGKLFSARYALAGNFHQNHSTTHDTITNTLEIIPGFQMGRYSVHLAGSYSHFMVRGSSYERYMEEFGAGPLIRRLTGENHILEMYGGYLQKEYAQPPSDLDEDRDSKGYDLYLSWIWLFKKSAFFNLKCEYIDEDADGINWDNDGYKASAMAIIPLFDRVKLQLGSSIFLQEYENTHTTFNLSREDEIHDYSAGLIWEFMKNSLMVFQYSRTRAHSNLKIYDYVRDLYSAGMEYRF